MFVWCFLFRRGSHWPVFLSHVLRSASNICMEGSTIYCEQRTDLSIATHVTWVVERLTSKDSFLVLLRVKNGTPGKPIFTCAFIHKDIFRPFCAKHNPILWSRLAGACSCLVLLKEFLLFMFLSKVTNGVYQGQNSMGCNASLAFRVVEQGWGPHCLFLLHPNLNATSSGGGTPPFITMDSPSALYEDSTKVEAHESVNMILLRALRSHRKACKIAW